MQAYKDKWLAGSDESYATAKTNAGLTYPVLSADGYYKAVGLSWTAVNGATRYGIYLYDKDTKKYTKVDLNVTGTSYTVTGLEEETEYTFFVQAYKDKWLPGADGSYATAKTYDALTYPIVTAESGDNWVTLTWTAVKDAAKYGVYFYDTAKDKYSKIDLDVTDTTYTVTGLKDVTEYDFFVQAYTTKWLAGGFASYIHITTKEGLAYPVLSAEGGDKSVTLTWTAVSGATKYGVYRVVNGKYTKLDLNVTDTSYTVTGLAADTEYTFFVQPYTTKWLAVGDESCVTVKTE